MAAEIRFRRGTAEQWATTSEVLDAGEPGFDVTNGVLKVGNGRDKWADLPSPSSGGGSPANHTHAAADIRDATGIGRSLLTAPDAQTARGVLNVPEDDLPSLVLLLENGLV